MSNSPNRPILFKGETYSKAIEKTKRLIPPEPKISYEEAREILLEKITDVKNNYASIPEQLKLPNEMIISLRVATDHADKNYYPANLLYPVRQDSELEEVGSRLTLTNQVSNKVGKKDEKLYNRIFFIRTTETGLEKFNTKLKRKVSDLTKGFMLDVRKVSSLDLIGKNERITGFNTEWNAGKIEVTLHPFSLDRSIAVSHFRNFLSSHNYPINEIRLKQYESEGLTFTSFSANRNLVGLLGEYNPIRSIHPISFRNFNSKTEISYAKGGPKIAIATVKSGAIVGVIDGGYVQGNTGMDQYVDVVETIGGPADLHYAGHGTLVTSALLFGPLNGFANTDILGNPEIRVRNFRVIKKSTAGVEPYETIDMIEKIVPENPEIQVYNISFGPEGPILDTDIDRFTYALDLLSRKYNVLFCVAVGNKGNVKGYERIQSPSDLVNGLAVGSYYIKNGEKLRADYSCIGPGREGNKLKPDILAFGGNKDNKLELSFTPASVVASLTGTSFSTPLVTATAGKLIAKSNGFINALTARALIVHTANIERKIGHSVEMGHGFLPPIASIIECANKSYTLIFEGEVPKGAYREFPIPWAEKLKGACSFEWTLAIQCDVDSNSPEDYTSSSVELTFHPNYYRHNFSKKDVSGKFLSNQIDIDADPDIARQYEIRGWKKSRHPIAESADKQINGNANLRGSMAWDSLDTRHIRKMAKSIKDPAFQVHAISRGHRREVGKVRFAIVLTVTAQKAEFDVYSKIIARYNELVPLRMESTNQQRVFNSL